MTSASEQTSARKRAINHELETAANVYAHDHGSPVAAYASALHQAFMAGARFMEGQPDELSKAQERNKQLEYAIENIQQWVSNMEASPLTVIGKIDMILAKLK